MDGLGILFCMGGVTLIFRGEGNGMGREVGTEDGIFSDTLFWESELMMTEDGEAIITAFWRQDGEL